MGTDTAIETADVALMVVGNGMRLAIVWRRFSSAPLAIAGPHPLGRDEAAY